MKIKYVFFTAFIVTIFSIPCRAQNIRGIYTEIDSARYEDAIENIDVLLKKDKKNAELLFLKGKANSLISKREKSHYLQMKYRKRANDALKRAMWYGKDNVEFLLEYAILQMDREYWMEAESAFTKILDLDATNQLAFKYLIDIYTTFGRQDDLKQFEGRFEQIDKGHPSVSTKHTLYQVYKMVKKWDDAERVMFEALRIDSTCGLTYYYLSQIYFKKKQPDEMTDAYYKFLQYAKTDEEEDIMLREVHDIVSEEQYEDLYKTPKEKRGKHLLKFWKGKDANPITFINERLVEHFNRLKFARTFYGRGFTGYDDRGKWYVKFGPPDEKYVQSIQGFTGYNRTARVIPPNESWLYSSIDRELAVDFMGNEFYMREVDSFPGDIMNQMYKDREFLGGDYYQMANHPGRPAIINDFVMKKTRAKQKAFKMVDRFIPKLPYRPSLNFAIDACRFIEDGKTKVEVYYGLANRSLAVPHPSDNGEYSITFSVKTVAQDQNEKELYRNEVKNETSYFSKEKLLSSGLIGQESFLMDADEAKVFLEIVENVRNTGNIKRIDVTGKSPQSDSLRISDIQFSSKIDEGNPGGMYVKNGIEIVPYPFSAIGSERQIYTYLEIYNLSFNAEGKADYKLTYTIKQDDGNIITQVIKTLRDFISGNEEWSISHTYNRSAQSTKTFENLLFDLTPLNKGNYILEIEVTDTVSGNKAKTAKRFFVTD